MRILSLCYIIIPAVCISSCKFSCSAGVDNSAVKTKPVTSSDNSALTGAVIKNDIDLDAAGVKLKEAYLMDANDQLLTENKTRIGEKIFLVLKTDTGWVKENDRSYIGASERISTKAGRVIIEAKDIFKDYEATGIPADKAGAITLSARITEADPGVTDFVVQFRVWDKKGGGEIKGKYTFSLKD